MKPSALPIGTKQVLVAFPTGKSERPGWTQDPGATRRLTAQVQFPFLPLGLFLWGATSETYVTRIGVASWAEVDVAGIRLPGRFFQANYTFEGMLQLALRGELELAIEERQLLEMNQAEVGHVLGLDIEGPVEQACLWGLTYLGDGPTLRATIEVVPEPYRQGPPGHPPTGLGPTYTGQLIERRLRGDRVIGEASAPSERSVCSLLAALRPHRY
jgi:hypothetical protein